MIPRAYEPLSDKIQPGRVLVIYGPRRVGKSTLVSRFLAQTPLKYRNVSGDDIRIQTVLSSQSISRIGEFCEGLELLVVDEAQNIPLIGSGLKIIVDHFPRLYVIATGSSSFDLSNKIGEPLVGRQRVLKLFPIAQSELAKTMSTYELKMQLGSYLIFGTYPEVVTLHSQNEKREFLLELVNSYLLKDLLAIENIKSPRMLMDLLRLLAFQVGSEVSLNELANQLKIDAKTVFRYLDLLEKSFIIFSLSGLSRNLRNEVTAKKKYYFLDNGIRNAVINHFNAIDMRADTGQLWENFLVMERIKKQTYEGLYSNNYFWRTYNQKEIDWVEERDGRLFAFELKWSPQPHRTPREWREAYHSEVEVISKENYLAFV
jgi:predicted AAA+ superfamily ATPase